MEQWEIDWYKELMSRYLKLEVMSEDDHYRLNYLRNRYVCEVATHPPAAVYAARVYVDHPGAAAVFRVP